MDNPTLAMRIDVWTREAMAKWGDDWSRISRHIERQLAALTRDEQRQIAAETSITLLHTTDGNKQ